MFLAAVTCPPVETYPSTSTSDGVRFTVFADIDAGTLPRVLQLFAKRGLIPDSVRADRRDDVLTIEIVMAGMEAELAAYIGRCLQAIYVVRAVEVAT